MKKYMVIAIQFDSESMKQQEFVIGEFNTYMNAALFRDAYNKHYSASAWIQEVSAR